MNIRKFLSLLFCLFPLFTMAQVIQPCVVKEYNQKEEKKPLPGVQVEVRGAVTEVSDAQGALTLSFTTLKPGDRVVKRDIKKDGFEVFNTSAVEQWTISRDRTPFLIVLVRSDYMRQLEQTLRQNSIQNYKLKYEQTKRDLAAEKAAGKIKEEEYRQQMEKLEDQYDDALKDLDNYIDQFAHFDLNEVNAEEQRILDMVQQGQIDEAVKAYENLQLSEKLLQERADLKKLDEVSARVEEEKVRKKENVTRLWESLDREITTLKLAGGPENFEKIGRILKEQALADTADYQAVKEYADFAYEQTNYQEAERFYNICLGMGLEDSVKYNVLAKLGLVFAQSKKYAKAEQNLLSVMNYYTKQFDQNPEAYRSNLANTQNNLGNLYLSLEEYTKSEKYYLAALEHDKILYDQNPDAHRSDLASTQNNLGNFYWSRQDNEKAKVYYLAALEHYKILFDRNSDACRPAFTLIQRNLGNLYWSVQDSAKAEEHYLAALEYDKVMFEHNPEAWRSYLATEYRNLGVHHLSCKNYAKAEECLLLALEHFKILFDQNPDAWRSDLAKTQNNLGVLYVPLEEYTKSEAFSLAALDNYKLLYDQNPDAWRSELATTQQSLGDLYLHSEDYEKSEQYYLVAQDHYKILFDQDPEAWRSDFASIHENTGNLYVQIPDSSKAEEHYLLALEQYQFLNNQNPKMWSMDLAILNWNLGNLYLALNKLPQSERCFIAVLGTRMALLQEDTTVSNCAFVINLEQLLAKICVLSSSYKKAEQYYLSAMEHCKLLSRHDSVFHRTSFEINHDLAQMYHIDPGPEKALSYYMAALEDEYYFLATDTVTYCEKVNDLELTVCDLLKSLQKYDLLEKYCRNAADHCEWLYKKDPDFYDTRLSIIYLELTEAYVRNKKYAQAVACMDRMIALYPNDPGYYDRKGEILLMNRNGKEALIMWHKVMELDPDFLKHLEEAGRTSGLYKGLKDKGLVK